MALTASDIDLGGNNLHVQDIYYGATGVGQIGTKLDITQPPTIILTATACNFNATNGTDIATFTIPTLPTGFTRFIVSGLYVSHASHTLATAYLGLFTSASAGGTALTSGTTSGINLTVTATADITANNAQSVTLTTAPISCVAATETKLYANLVTQEGATATADITVVLQLLP